MEHVIELIEINIHDWTHKLGHLAAHLMPTSVTIRRCPAGREGSLLRSGMGRMPVTVLKKERDHRGATVTSPLLCAPMSALLRKDIIYIYMDQRELWACSPGRGWTECRALSPPSRLLWASVNGGCSTEPCQPPHTPPATLR